MSHIKRVFKNYLSTYLTVEEVFLVSIVMMFNFIPVLYNISANSIEQVIAILALVSLAFLIFLAPSIATAKVIFGNSKLTSSRSFELSIFGTMWILVVMSTSLISLFIELKIFEMRSGFYSLLGGIPFMHYLYIIYIINLSFKLISLFLFSSYLGIKRFDILHFPINKIFLVLAIIFALLISHSNQIANFSTNSLMTNFIMSSVNSYIIGSLFFNIYYLSTSKKPMLD